MAHCSIKAIYHVNYWDVSNVKRCCFFKRSNNRHTKQKKSIIVQQTIWITDYVATCINVHTIELHIHYSVCCRALIRG